MKKRFQNRYKATKAWLQKHERVLVPATLVSGVIVDAITFATIDVVLAFSILIGHVLLVGWAIAFLQGYDARVFSHKSRVLQYARLVVPYVIQFSFGALLSAVFIFYVFSGSIWVSWPFVLLLVVLMISNDVFRHYYMRARIQMGLYFFILFALSAVMLPYGLQKMGAWLFIFSGIFAIGLIWGYIKWLAGFVPTISFGIKRFEKPIIIIFVVMNALYFLNVIPPVPLSLRDSVVGHGITRNASGYAVEIEKQSFFQKIIPGQRINRHAGDSVIVYTAIFAPGDLRARVYHNWQHKEDGAWVSKGRFSYTVFGGRQDGFRGYSQKSTLEPGRWRVDVETERGQVMGRVRFSVREGDSGELERIVKYFL